MKPVKHAISYVIYNKNRSKVLSVLRPSHDKHLAGIWGLPAGYVEDKETFEQALVRSGRQKLGVELEIVEQLTEGELERDEYILKMKLYEVLVKSGRPSVPQPVPEVTQYVDWQWKVSAVLNQAAKRGSLCSRLFLSS